MGWRDEIAKAVIAAATPKVAAPIRAFHSSPYDFERFDPSKIGTGQGAASYGVGHYLAENPKVSGQGGEYWKEFLGKFMNTPEGEAARELMHSSFNRENAMDVLRRDMRGREFMGETPRYAQTQEALRLLESGKPVGPRTYEVDIHARPEQFLDWDRPLNKQQPGVVEGLQRAMRPRQWEEFNPAQAGDAVKRGFIGLDERIASDKLREQGIPGIRYLDQGSRVSPHTLLRTPDSRFFVNSKEYSTIEEARAAKAALDADYPRTSNYVVFPGNEGLLDIKAKYGLAGAVPTMGALADPSLYGSEANAQ